MAIKYVSGKTKELKVGLSSYSEGKPSLQVTGNVGVGTTNPLSLANPANTSVISAGIVTANKLYGDIVATGVGITNLYVSGISTFIGNVHVSAAGTVGLGTTAYFGYNNDFKIYDDTDIGKSSSIYTNNTLQLKSRAQSGFVGIKSEVTLTFGMGLTYLESDLTYLNTTSGTLFEADARAGGVVRLRYGNSTKLTTRDYGIDVTGILETDGLYNSGISTFVGFSSFIGISSFTNDVNFVGNPVGTSLTSVQFHKGDGSNSDLDALRLYDSAQLSVGAGATGGFTMQGNWNGAGPTFNSFILTRGDNFFIDGGSSTAIKIRTNFVKNAIVANSDNGGSGTVELYHSVGGTSTKRFETSGIGVSVYDALNVAGVSSFVGLSTFNDDVEFIGNAAGITSAFWDKSANELKFYDGSKITLGDGQDLELSHNGTDSLIRDSRASGSVLRIGADKLWLQNKDGNEPYLEATDNGSVKLYHDFAPRFETTGIGISVAGIGSTAYIEGPSNIVIDPHPYGIGTTSGNVFIKGDLYVEGTEFIVDVDKIELGDFQIGIATTAGTNALLDGAGIGIGSTNIRKFITWNNATNALMTSENWNLASGKHYEINGTDVLTSDTLLVGTGASVHSPSNNILTLHTNGAEKLRIDASGNLGIGTAVPTDSANAANTSVTSAGIVTALEYYGIFKGSIPGFSTVFSSGQGSFSATPGAPYTIDTFAFSTHDYQIAEYTLHFVHANGIQAQKALVMQDNSVAYSNEYGVMYDSELLVSIAATVSGGSVNITATPETGISGVTTFRWRREVQT